MLLYTALVDDVALSKAQRISKRVRDRVRDKFKRMGIPVAYNKLVNVQAITRYLSMTAPDDIKNYEIDHVCPLASFDLRNPMQIRIAFAPENHQWMYWRDNRTKGARHNDDVQRELVKRYGHAG